MKILKTLAIVALMVYASFNAAAQDPQQQEPIDFAEIAEKQADAFQKRFNLDAVQLFRIDSLYQHDLPAMDAEMQGLRKAGMWNTNTYQAVSDKWMDIMDKGIEKIFTEEQWQKYMKSANGKEKQKRDKRLAKAAQAKQTTDKK
ncbi:MAG: hypothetical protein HUJ92_07020 [Bacteroidales bacterium]|nr:hypothetical protein [Bacteroidales bacterium]